MSIGTSVRIVADLGDLVIEIFDGRAPQSAAAFLRYVDEGCFEEASFYRAVRPDNDQGTPPISVLQATSVLGAKKPLTVEHESTAVTRLLHLNGTISLGRTKPGTGTPAAFFNCIGDQPALDYGGRRACDGLGYAAFGRVIDGLGLVAAFMEGPRGPTRVTLI